MPDPVAAILLTPLFAAAILALPLFGEAALPGFARDRFREPVPSAQRMRARRPDRPSRR